MSAKPFIAPCKVGESLLLKPAPNGGWIVQTAAKEMFKPTILGAFSCGDDMRKALEDLADWLPSDMEAGQ